MDTAGYVTLTRQTGLLKELQAVSNNIANISTSGFRREGIVFAESIQALETEGGGVAMTSARVRYTDSTLGGTSKTGGDFDFAIDGKGYFLVETPVGERLTRAGSFSPNSEGDLVTMTGHRVLDASGTPIFIPPDADVVGVSNDGTISIDGRSISQIGIYDVSDPQALVREDGVLFKSDEAPVAVEDPKMLQGYLESSNVDAVGEMARLIEVQRAYEFGQKLLDNEDKRIMGAIKALARNA